MWQGPAAPALTECEFLFPDPVGQFDAREDDAGICEGLEAEHTGASSFHGTMILLDYIVKAVALFLSWRPPR